MKLHRDLPLYSATDLLNFLGCTHATALDVTVMGGAATAPEEEKDEYHDILKQKGLEHESRHLARLKEEGKSVAEIPDDLPLDEKAELTRKAMQQGFDVIYQGALIAPGWHGYSDFLIKVGKPSTLGDYSYEVVDTKLARTAKPKHLVQLCMYADLVAGEQGVRPGHIHVMLGDGSQATLRLDDFIYYSNRARNRFESFVSAETRDTVAEPCGHCEMCRWAETCDAAWEEAGHLQLVAGLGRPQARKLRMAGIDSIDALAAFPADATITKMQSVTLDRLRSQARLQMIKRTTGENTAEIIPAENGRGFARLPQPDDGDLFFDIEGDPVYSPEGSLEYLFGFH
jgi:uncharacterized protein